MRFAVLAALLVVSTPGFTPVAFAQDEEEAEEEGGDDMDELMNKDPEKEKKEGEEGAAAQGESETSLEQVGDEERPPGEEAKPVEAEPTAEPESESSGRDKPISIGLLVGYGISLESGMNVWGVGFGLGGGYNFGNLYFGARFAYYIGDSETQTRPNFGLSIPDMVDVSENVWELGAELGYDIEIGTGAYLRPGLGIGLASSTFSADGGTGISDTFAYFAPGLGLFYGVTESIYLGVDVRFQLVMSDPAVKAIIPLAGLGMHF